MECGAFVINGNVAYYWPRKPRISELMKGLLQEHLYVEHIIRLGSNNLKKGQKKDFVTWFIMLLGYNYWARKDRNIDK